MKVALKFINSPPPRRAAYHAAVRGVHVEQVEVLRLVVQRLQQDDVAVAGDPEPARHLALVQPEAQPLESQGERMSNWWAVSLCLCLSRSLALALSRDSLSLSLQKLTPSLSL